MSLVDKVISAGLAGRGGSAFPTGRKLQAITGKTALIVNACDGELGSRKDRWVVNNRTKELLRGAELIQGIAGGPVCFAVRRGSDAATELRWAGVEVLDVPRRYVSSEETALISLNQGGLARPLTKRRLYVHGGRDSTGRKIKPTIEFNAETVWRVAQIEQYGPEWFRRFGTAAEPGPRLATVTGHVEKSVVVETQAGVAVGELLTAAGVRDDAQYLLFNGLAGAFAPLPDITSVPWSAEGLATYSARIGPGVVEVLDPGRCVLGVVGDLLAYAAGESAGQCGPCMFGVPELAALWTQFIRTPSDAHRQALTQNLGLLPGRGGCKFPDGVARVATSALTVFADHINDHAHSGRCPTRRAA